MYKKTNATTIYISPISSAIGNEYHVIGMEDDLVAVDVVDPLTVLYPEEFCVVVGVIGDVIPGGNEHPGNVEDLFLGQEVGQVE